MNALKIFKATIIVCCLVQLISCKKDDVPKEPMEMAGPDLNVFGLTTDNKLILFSAANPSSLINTVSLSGLESAETIISIDFRPATGELYGLGSSGRLYIINYDNGKARPAGTAPFTPALTGTSAAIDFNPTVDRLRLVSTSGQNLRLHPETGAVVFVDGTIAGPAGTSINAVGYTNSMAGATTTTLYDIDFAKGVLYKQDPPNNGTLVMVGSLGVTSTGMAGFDISPDNIHAIAVATKNATSSDLFLIDLNTGKASKIRSVPSSIRDIAIPTVPVAYAVDGSNTLHIFNPDMPGATITKPLTGLPMGAMIEGIDFRPVNGQLYALGSNSQLYTINTSNGATAAVGSPFTTPLTGTAFGFDFNPTVDRIRVVSNSGQNLRLNPNDGAVAVVDGMLNPGMPIVSSAAYTNNFAGTTSTELLVMDISTGKLLLQNPPNNGTLVERGSLGVTATMNNGFDISGRTNKGLAILTSGSATGVYTINLLNGAATNMKPLGISIVKGFALAPGY
jgi:hypothetical protein